MSEPKFIVDSSGLHLITSINSLLYLYCPIRKKTKKVYIFVRCKFIKLEKKTWKRRNATHRMKNQ